MGVQSWIILVVISATFMQTCRAVDDKILRLPGQPRVSFQQYAGYVTVDENQDRALFYYLVEAESNPASKPLVIWLNGGPGCSSVGEGVFTGNGPFRPSGGGRLVRHDYSWNKEANMLYLESPAGVGFSYSANQSFYKLVNDTITAQDNFVFLQNWFMKFPEYKNRDLFITGVSYAGHYIPQLADLIVKSGLKFNLQGIALGNPLLEFNTDSYSEGDFYWSHGLISNPTYELLKTTCNTSQLWREQYITGNMSAACSKVNDQLNAEMPDAIDRFDVTANVCLSSNTSLLGVTNHHALSQRKSGENIDPCAEAKTSVYLNRKDVIETLHAKLVGTPQWNMCTTVANYDFGNWEIPTIDVVGSLVSSGIRVLVFSGDQDSRVPLTASRTLVDGLAKKLGLNATVPYTPWFVDKQVGGWTQVYGDLLTFTTVRGGAHMVPFSSPGRALKLFAAFLSGKPLV